MRFPPLAALFACVVACGVAGPARAVDRCDLNGQAVNPNNGNTTAGKTGLMRCRDGDGGPVVREQELQDGKFMGVVRYYRDGQLEKDYRVNGNGNRDGVFREYARGESGGAKPVLVREETYVDGREVGLSRTWYPSGQLRRVSFRDEQRELASADFNADGKLYDLRCGPRAVLGGDADDARWCGHSGGASNVVLYNSKGVAKARVSYERGERRRNEVLGEGGAVREVQEASANGGVERTFWGDGAKRREVQWVVASGERPRRVNTVDQEFHESGKLVRERRWKVGERGGDLVSEQSWYLNGQPKERTEYVSADGRALRQETTYHDNGAKASEGSWRVASPASRGRDVATGVHRSFDEAGRLRGERFYDDAGRITRERALDGNGNVVRDDEVFEDGSRKAYGR